MTATTIPFELQEVFGMAAMGVGLRHGAPNVQTSVVTTKVSTLQMSLAIGSKNHIMDVAACSSVQSFPAFS